MNLPSYQQWLDASHCFVLVGKLVAMQATCTRPFSFDRNKRSYHACIRHFISDSWNDEFF